MTRRNYRRVSGILTDHCESCGTWIDHGSVQRILWVVATGRIPELDRLAATRECEDAERARELSAPRERDEAGAALAEFQTGMIEIRARQDTVYRDLAGFFYDVLHSVF
jgi:hypothetical protein